MGDKDTTTITCKDGTKKTIPGYFIVVEPYLFTWQHRAADDEYCYSLFRYDLNSDKKAAITSMQNRDIVELTYFGGALYFIEKVIEDYELKGYIVYKLGTNGKLSTFVDRSNQKNSPHGLCIVVASSWLFLYDETENNGLWGNFESKHRITTNMH